LAIKYLDSKRIRGSSTAIIIDGDYTVLKFTDDGTFTPTEAITAEILVIAGGGGASSGGGGAGGLLTKAEYSMTAQAYTITVGAGGTGTDNAVSIGGNGVNSTIDPTSGTTITAVGGGGGGRSNGAGASAGASGGSGGGGGASNGGTPAAGAATQGDSGGATGVGFAGGVGRGSTPHGGGGGGGASEVGQTAPSSAGQADGGDGVQNDITGSNIYYAGGGGAFHHPAQTAGGSGGQGGGGQGGASNTAGTDGLGAGGGGGHGDNDYLGKDGGSGVVIFRFLTAKGYSATGDYGDIDEKATLVTAAVTAGTGWTINETANAGNVAITSEELVLNSLASVSNSGSLAYYDLGASTVSSTEWILRWEWYFTSVTGAGASAQTIDVGLSSGYDGAGSAGSNGGSWSPAEKIAMIFLSSDSSDDYLQQVNGSGSANVYTTNVSRTNLAQGINFTTVRYYMQLRRFSDSGTDTIEAKYFTNSDYTTGLQNTTTRTANMPSDLRYIKAEIWGQSSTSSTAYTKLSSTSSTAYTKLDNIKFWNGTSTSGTPTYETSFADVPASSNLPENTIFEQTNDYKYYFLQSDAWVAEA